MALKPLRPCRHPGCCVLVSDGYCDAHRPRGDRRSEEAQSWRWMYQTDEWKLDLRPAQLLREPFCRECAKQYPPGDPRHRTRATVVDHITPFRGAWALFIDPANHQSLCKSCHDRKTAKEQAEKRRNRGGI